ncbi:MAG: OmpA family protein [Gammaproteobacteria bacterium]|nr:OmpA family protein [Gammaproteobacteria bacterium]
MKKNHLFALTLISVSVLAGCSTMPQSTTLDNARTDYNHAQANPQVVKLAPLQLKEAGEALDRANAAQVSREDAKVVDSLAYVAQQKIALTQETAQRKSAELAVSNATAERNKLQLQARTAEADQAHQQAAMAELTAEQKTAEANLARQQAADAQAGAAQDQASLAAMQAQMDELNAKKTPRGMVITLGDVLFDTNRAQLKSGGERNVQKLAEFLKRYPQRTVLIEGFTDSVGSDSSNQVLSEQRAQAVSMALTDMGVSRDRVSTKGYGEAYAVAGNDTASGRQLNRRVEIMLSDERGVIAPR